VDAFNWSLHEIDITDIESLIPFVFGYPHWKSQKKPAAGGRRTLHADQVDWL
jgi:hypothetical protein